MPWTIGILAVRGRSPASHCPQLLLRQLAPGLRASTVGLAPSRDGFLATYSVDWSALRAERLRCRQSAALGPPTAIAPIK